MKPLQGALTSGTTPTLTREQLAPLIEAYAEIRPSRTRVAAALRRLMDASPRDAQVFLKIWNDKMQSGEWPVDEPRQVNEFVDQQGVRYLRPSSLTQRRDGTIRHGRRNCKECDGNGWHHKEYPDGKTTATRCGECQQDHVEYIREKNRKAAKASKRGASKEAW